MRMYLLAVIVGLIAGSLGAAFHYCVDQVLRLHEAIGSRDTQSGVSAVIISAVVGLVMAGGAFVVVRRFAPESAGSGIQEIEGAMSDVRRLRWARVLPVKFVSGVLSIGAGLVLGREGPTIHIGGCVGRMIAGRIKDNIQMVHTLVAAGAAAGLSTAFGAPLAGVLFVTEEMRRHFNYTFVSLHAVALASFAANIVNSDLFGIGPALPLNLKDAVEDLAPHPEYVIGFVPLFCGLGVLVGVCGAGYNAGLLSCLRVTDRLSALAHFGFTAASGAAAGALLVTAPAFVGEGDSLVQSVFSNPPAIGFLLALLAVRVSASFLSYSTGVPGGIFAPMLAVGAVIGMVYAHLIHAIAPGLEMQAGWFAIAAMGGFFAASVRAPLTGIVLIAELTSSFEQWPALIMTCITASITAQAIGSTPVYDLLLDRTMRAKASCRGASQTN